MPNPITPKNPRGAGLVAEGYTIKVQICQLSGEAVTYLERLAKEGKRSEYLRNLVENDIAKQKTNAK